MDMARQVWDESRQVEIYLKLLEHVGGYAGEYPESPILRCTWRKSQKSVWRGSIVALKGSPVTSLPSSSEWPQKIGDPVIEQAVDYVLADEITMCVWAGLSC